MDNKTIRQRAFEIFKSNIIIFTGIQLLPVLTGSLDELSSLSLSIISMIIAVVLEPLIAYFNVRAWLDKPALSNLFVPLTDPVYRKKLISLMLVYVGGLAAICAPFYIGLMMDREFDPLAFIFINWAPILFFLLVLMVIAFIFAFIWHIFAVDPTIPTFEIFKQSASYMANNFGSYIGFTFSLVFIPAIASSILERFLSPLMINILLSPVNAYIAFAITGFTLERILIDKLTPQIAAEPQQANEITELSE